MPRFYGWYEKSHQGCSQEGVDWDKLYWLTLFKKRKMHEKIYSEFLPMNITANESRATDFYASPPSRVIGHAGKTMTGRKKRTCSVQISKITPIYENNYNHNHIQFKKHATRGSL